MHAKGDFSDKHEDADLLNVIYQVYKDAPTESILIEWIPAHLDDPRNSKKREKFLRSGGTEADIEGNAGADRLAGIAANRHDWIMIRPRKARLR